MEKKNVTTDEEIFQKPSGWNMLVILFLFLFFLFFYFYKWVIS